MVFNGARLESKFVYVSQRLRNFDSGRRGIPSQALWQPVRDNPGRTHVRPVIVSPGEGTWLRAL